MALLRISNMGVRPALTAVLRYALALASVAAALGVSIILVHYHLPRLFGAFSSAAIAISFWYAGTGPGILAILLSSSAFYFLLSPVTEVKGPGWEAFVVIYVMFSVLAGWFSFSRRRAERLLADARDNLESRVAERSSELVLANQELRRTQDYMAETQKLTHTGTCVWRVSTREYIYWSDEMFRIVGLEPQKMPLTYQSTLEMLHVDDRPQFERIAEQAIAGKRSGELDFRVVRPDGSVRHMRAVFHPVLDQAGNVVELWRTGVDITERVQAEEAMRAIEERWRGFFAASFAGLAVLDSELRYVQINRTLAEMNGPPVEEHLGKSLREVLPGLAPTLEPTLRRVLATGKAVNVELSGEVPSQPGVASHYVACYFPIPRGSGLPADLGAVVVDLTQLKRAQEELRQSEERFRTLFQTVQVGVVVSGPKSEALMCNPAALELLGLSEDELLGTTSYDPKWVTFYEDGSPCPVPEHPIPRAIATGQPVRNLLLGVDLPSSGRRVWLLVNALPQTAPDGSVSRVICTFLDLTDRKRTQEELERSRDQLRALAARLEYVREEERTGVAREIHDELGSALTAIKIDLSSLLHDLSSEKQQEGSAILQQVDETIQSMRRISTDLRPGILDTLGPVAAIEWAAEEFEARTGIRCRLGLTSEDLSIEPERATALFRIFQETLTNVARHANATELKVRLAKDDGNLLLEIHDNGKGISEEQISKSRSLGIVGMRERALLLGGELTIHGAPGAGTTVMLRIPQTQPKPA